MKTRRWPSWLMACFDGRSVTQFTATTPDAVETEYSALRASLNDSNPEPLDAPADEDKVKAMPPAIGPRSEEIFMRVLVQRNLGQAVVGYFGDFANVRCVCTGRHHFDDLIAIHVLHAGGHQLMANRMIEAEHVAEFMSENLDRYHGVRGVVCLVGGGQHDFGKRNQPLRMRGQTRLGR